MADLQQNIAALLSEERVFEPPAGFVAEALVKDRGIYERAEADVEGFWAEQADRLTWFKKWDTVMEWSPPWVKWFTGGTLNASYNCLDRHVEAGGGDKVAYHWEGEPGEQRTVTYKQLLEDVCRFANALKGLGVKRGDRVAIYLGMIPELPVAVLACARIGAPHSVVFGGFSAEALRDRINDAEAKVVITQDGGYRRGQVVPLKANADEALEGCPTIEHVITVRRAGNEHPFSPGRDHWYPGAGRGTVARVPAGGDGRRGHPVPPLHQRDHRQAQGDRAHHRRLPGRLRCDPLDDLRHPRGRRGLVLGRHRLGDHRVRAAGEPHHGHHVRGRRTGRTRTGCGPSSSDTRPPSCTRSPPPSGRSRGGGRSTRRSTT